MTDDAQTVINYLLAKGYNSTSETATDCALDEVRLDAALEEIDDAGMYRVHKAVRRESYGREVLWLTRRRP